MSISTAEFESARDLAPGPRAIEHATPQLMTRALQAHAVWFPAHASSGPPPATVAKRATIHRHGPLAALTVADLRPPDLPALAGHASFAFVNRSDGISEAFPEGDLSLRVARAGIALLRRHGDEAASGAGVPSHRRMGSVEFLLSDASRLVHSPVFGAGRMRSEDARVGGPRRAVAVLDLIQDFEVLRPLLARAAAPGSPFELRLAISDRVVKSTLWSHVQQFVAVHEIDWFTPLGASDVTNALGSEKSLLLTASESTAAAHGFGHSVCRIAPPRTLRVTLQHGLECIGLRHHRAHDFDFPKGVRFASDLVLTWADVADLPDLHPGEIGKCIAVGVIKATAERAAGVAERRWLEGAAVRGTAGPQRLLIAENLHSVRFRAPGRHQRFLGFIHAAQESSEVDLTIRSHPASRILEKQRENNQLKFLDDMLRLDDLAKFDAFVSPPSTILFDAVLAGVPAAVWSDAPGTGDAVNYDGLPVVTDFADWAVLGASEHRNLDALAWAVRSTTGLNGVPAAWNTIVGLFD